MKKHHSEFERPFKDHELFFSTTDKKGIITSGNETFFKVSGYGESDAVGKPHNIIRHEDMPKSVFKLLWTTIESKRPIAAYVKNRAIDGSYYWVFATVFPILDGYLSIRLKPKSDYFKAVPGLYAEMQRLEKSAGMGNAVAFLEQTLGSLGIQDYRDFMTRAIVAELTELNAMLDLQDISQTGKNTTTSNLSTTLKQIATVSNQFANLNSVLSPALQIIESSFISLKSLSINMALAGTHLGKKAAAVNVIAETFLKLSEESNRLVSRIKENHSSFKKTLIETEFKVASTHLQTIMLSRFITEGRNADSKLELLMNLAKDLLRETTEALGNMGLMLGRFLDTYEQTDQSILALELVRLSGKVESAQIEQGAAAVDPYLNELESIISGLTAASKSIADQSQSLRRILNEHTISAQKATAQFSHADVKEIYK